MASIQIYSDLVFPLKLALASGLTGRIERNNNRSNSPSGPMAVNVRQSRSLRKYSFGTVPVKFEVWQTLEGFFEVTDAGGYGFLLEDPKDVGVDTGLLYPYAGSALVGTVGLGYGVPVFRLYKRYTALGSTRTKDRRITRPQATPVVKRGGVTVVYGGAAGNAAIDLDTGVVTFVADTSQALTSITGGATTTLTFANNTGIYAAMAVGQRVYVLGVSGTAAAILNGLSHVVASKSGNSLVVSTVTTGLSGTGGTAYKYPQASEAMTWTGKMYVPVHFDEDNLDWSMVRPGSLEGNRLFIGPGIQLGEIWED